MGSNIKKFLQETEQKQDSSSNTNSGDNSKKEIKAKILSIISSMNAMDEERLNIKILCEELKGQFGIEPKTSKSVANMIRDPEKLAKARDHMEKVLDIYGKVS